MKVRTLAEFEGILWAESSRCGNGATRSKLDLLRLIRARELLVATCNVRVLGAQWAWDGEAEQAARDLRGTSCRDITRLDLKLKDDRDCNERVKFNPGAATPEHAQRIAVDPTRPSGQECCDEGGDDE